MTSEQEVALLRLVANLSIALDQMGAEVRRLTVENQRLTDLVTPDPSLSQE